MKIIVFLFLAFLTFGNLSAQEEFKSQRVLLAGYNFGVGLDSTMLPKLRAALNLSCDLTKKYSLISEDTLSSVLQKFDEEKKEITALSVAQELKADRILFANVGRIENILKVEINAYLVKEEEEMIRGIGYAFLNFRQAETNKALLDPSLLKATQIAFAEAIGESGIYTNLEGSLNVIPQIPTVVTGIYFNEEDGASPWKLFENKLVNSYDGVLQIFQNAKNARNHIVFDLDTRDTIYGLFKLYIIENYNRIAPEELDALFKIGVDNIISGEIKMQGDEALLQLNLINLASQSKTEIIKTESERIANDSIEEFRKAVAKLTKKILAIN